MGHRQKGKGHKRKRSWHRRGAGPDRSFARAVRRLERAGMGAGGDPDPAFVPARHAR